MEKIIMLCGKVGAGKTTYANKLRREKNAVILSCDELMLTLFDECLGERHDEIQHRCYEFLSKMAVNMSEADCLAVLDFGFWTEQLRWEARELFKSKGIRCELHYIKAVDEKRSVWLEKRNEILKNSTRREYIITEDMRKRFDMKFEEPKSADVVIES